MKKRVTLLMTFALICFGLTAQNGSQSLSSKHHSSEKTAGKNVKSEPRGLSSRSTPKGTNSPATKPDTEKKNNDGLSSKHNAAKNLDSSK